MSIQDSDYFLIDDGGVVKKIRADKLLSGHTSTYSSDKLLVNLSDYSSRFVYASDILSKIDSSHWMIIDRAGQNYKVNGTKILEYFTPVSSGAAAGSQVYTTAGSYQFTIPAGVTEVCVVCVGGGGGGGGSLNSTGSYRPTVGGGGVGLYGQGSSGSKGTNRSGRSSSSLATAQGYSGSGGTGTNPSSNSRTKSYGGGGAGNEDDGSNGAASGASGAVRILWGSGRAFPSTNVGQE